MRTTEFSDTDSERPLHLNASAKTLRVTDTKSSRCLFQLVPLEPRTEGTECPSLQDVLLQTPTTVQTDESPEKMRERAERNGYKNGTKYGSLTSQIKYDPKVQPFLKTPCTADSYTDKMKSKGVSGTSGTLAQEIVNGFAEKHRGLLLPTPLAVEREHPDRVIALKATGAGRINSRANGEQRPNGLIDFMQFYGMLPTPVTQDFKKRGPNSKQQGLGDMLYGMANGSKSYEQVKKSAAPDGQTFRLSPLFTQEMMGFPFGWTEFPFLSENGEQKP